MAAPEAALAADTEAARAGTTAPRQGTRTRRPSRPGSEPPHGRGRDRLLASLVACALGAGLVAAILFNACAPRGPVPESHHGLEAPAIGEEALAERSALAQALAAAHDQLDAAVSAITSQGYAVGYDVLDAAGNEVLSLEPDHVFYGASAIKGPFVLTAFASGAPGYLRPSIEAAIQWSDNDAYYRLRDEMGYGVLAPQLEAVGVDGFSRYYSFVWMTPSQLARLWLNDLGALQQEGETGDYLRQVFIATDHSAIGALPQTSGGAVSSAWSKAGWIESGDLSCTTDAGAIVLSSGAASDGAAPTAQPSDPATTSQPADSSSTAQPSHPATASQPADSSPTAQGADSAAGGDASQSGDASEARGDRTYVMAVMTDKGEDEEALGQVVRAIAGVLTAQSDLADQELAPASSQ